MHIPYWLRYALISTCSLIALWLVWPDTPDHESKDLSITSTGNENQGSIRARNLGISRKHPGTRSQLRRLPPPAATHPETDRVLGDDSISIPRAAVMLRKLAADRSIPLAQRVDALEHGLNLDVAAFSDFAAMDQIPAEMAIVLIEEVMNENSQPAIQIQIYMDLLSHPDPAVSTEAKEMLAFMVEDDFEEADLAGLMQMGRQKLDELGLEKNGER